jgi:hypothetical protein
LLGGLLMYGWPSGRINGREWHCMRVRAMIKLAIGCSNLAPIEIVVEPYEI